MTRSIVLVAVLVAACETSPPLPPPPARGDYAAEICPRLGARAAACREGFDPNECAKNVRCSAASFRDDAMHTLYGCLMSEPCVKAGGDFCWDYTARSFDGDPDVRAFRAACAAKANACPGESIRDACIYYGYFTPGGRAAYRNCIAQRCELVEDCMKSVEYPPGFCK